MEIGSWIPCNLMETIFVKSKYIFVFFLSISFFANNVFAYDTTTGHPFLTQNSIRVFNQFSKNAKTKIDEQKIGWIIQGAVEEDAIGRYLNHFYDPRTGSGLSDFLSAKDWSVNSVEQSVYLKGNQTWQNAVSAYVDGDQEKAFVSLGHILHLVEDMAVPAHTRNDPHPEGDPFELWVAKNGIEKFNNISITNFNNIGEFFDGLANYSNKYFLSKDSVSSNLNYNEIIYNKKIYLVSKDNFGNFFKIIEKRIVSGENVYTFDNIVHSDYYSLLAPKAISYGVGVIDLFFKEAEREKETRNLHKQNLTLLESVATFVYGLVNKSLSIFNNPDNVSSNLAVVSGVGDSSGEENNVGAVNISSIRRPNDNQINDSQDVNNSVDNNVDNQLVSLNAKNENLSTFVQEGNQVLKNDFSGNLGQEILKGNATSQELSQLKISGVIEPKFSFNSSNYVGFGGGGAQNSLENFSKESDIGESLQEEDLNPIDRATAFQQPATEQDSQIPESPIILSPLNFSQLNRSSNEVKDSSVIFTGTIPNNNQNNKEYLENQNIIWTSFSDATTTSDEKGNWSLVLNNFNQGTTTLKFYTSNAQYTTTSSPTTIEIFIDSESPNVFLNINECKNSLSKKDCILSGETNILNIDWSSSAKDLAYFTLNQKTNLDNKTITSQTIATTTQITLTGNQTYIFSVSATDNLGNTSELITQTVEINNLPVVINEIAWAGTQVSPSDEWIELYNNTDKEIDLSNWYIYADDNSPNINLENTIPAKGYYLIERKNTEETDEATQSPISDIKADLWTSFGSGLKNSGEELKLAYYKESSTTTPIIIDTIKKQTNWGGKGASVSSANLYISMERIDPTQSSGDNLENWSTNLYNDITNGTDIAGNKIFGTPKKRNSVTGLLPNEITQNTILTKENSPYLIKGDLTVNKDVTLTLEEGTIIKFAKDYSDNSSSLKVNGDVISKGNQENPVVLTSLFDDEFGGDTNSDGICNPNNTSSTAQCPHSGDWRRIEINSTSQNSSFAHTIFRYGGYYYSEIIKTMVLVQDANAQFNNSTFEKSQSAGLYFSNTTSGTKVENSRFLSNDDDNLINYGYGLYVNDGYSQIENNLFQNNKRGLFLSTSGYFPISATVNSNTFKHNQDYAISTILNNNTFSGNSGSDNGKNGILLRGELTQENFNSSLKKNYIPYVLFGNNGINTVVASSTLSVDAGVVVKFETNSNLNVFGDMELKGEDGNRVLFTSVDDDSDGTDVNSDGQINPILPTNGGVNFKPGSTSLIKYSDFDYLNTALNYENSPVSLQNTKFKENITTIKIDGQSVDETFFN